MRNGKTRQDRSTAISLRGRAKGTDTARRPYCTPWRWRCAATSSGLPRGRFQGRPSPSPLAVIDLLRALSRVGERNSAEIARVMASYFHARDEFEPVSRQELLDRRLITFERFSFCSDIRSSKAPSGISGSRWMTLSASQSRSNSDGTSRPCHLARAATTGVTTPGVAHKRPLPALPTNRPRMRSTKAQRQPKTSDPPRRPATQAALSDSEFAGAEPGDVDQYPVAATGYWIGTMLPVIMIIPRRPCRRKFARKPAEHIQRMTHHIDAFAVAEFAPINPKEAPWDAVGPASSRRVATHHFGSQLLAPLSSSSASVTAP